MLLPISETETNLLVYLDRQIAKLHKEPLIKRQCVILAHNSAWNPKSITHTSHVTFAEPNKKHKFYYFI